MNWLTGCDGYTQVYVVGCYINQSGMARHGIYWGPDNPNNDFGPCFKGVTDTLLAFAAMAAICEPDTIASIHATAFAIQQANTLNVQKLRVFTDCNDLFDAVNGQPLQNCDDYEELERLMQSVPIDIKFELFDARSGNQNHAEARRLTLLADVDHTSALSRKEIQGVIRAFLTNVIRGALTNTENDNRDIVGADDVLSAVKRTRALYGLDD